MKPFLAVLFVVGFTAAEDFTLNNHTAYGFLERYGIPEAERIRKAEESQLELRVVGGVTTPLGQYEYQAGLLISIIGLESIGVCGASLVSPNRLVTAAHCWFDGQHQGRLIVVVLGSVTIFTGGTRVETTTVAMHPDWNPWRARNDIAIVYLNSSISYSSTIGPIALPYASELNEDFVGSSAIASGYGQMADGNAISGTQILNHVYLKVISNVVCFAAFPLILQPTNLCTSGIGGIGTCRGDSGGPLVVKWNGRRILIGVTSFGSILGCQANLPSSYARVTSFIDFINQHIVI